MAPRGQYAKGVAKRAEILDAALEIIDRNGYSGATVKELAEAVGLSQNGLLHYFGSKDALFTEVIRHRGQLDYDRSGLAPDAEGGSGPDFTDALVGLASGLGEMPGFIQLLLRLAGEATEAGHSSHDYFKGRYATQRRLVGKAFADEQAAGRIRGDLDADQVAAMVFALVDGLHLQAMYEPAIDVAAHMRGFLRLLAPAQPEG